MLFDISNKLNRTYSNVNNTFINEYLSTIKNQDILIITSNVRQAINIYENININNKAYLWLEDDLLRESNLASSNDIDLLNNTFINNIYNNNRKVVITNINGILKPVPSKEELLNNKFLIKNNRPLSRVELSDFLIKSGYEKTKIVDSPGTYAIRGFVIDIMPDEKIAYRILLDENEVETIKTFNPITQRTIDKIEQLVIKPFVYSGNTVNIIDLLNNYKLILINQLQIEQKIIMLTDEGIKLNLIDEIMKKDYTALNYYLGDNNLDIFELSPKEINFNYYESNNQTVVYSISENQLEHFKKYDDIIVINNLSEVVPYYKNVIINGFSDSFKYKGIVYINLGQEVKLKKYEKKYVPSIDISDIEINDYVVHDIYGVGQFVGLVKLLIKGINKEYLKIKYLDKQFLYVPVEKLIYLKKYDISSGILPRINHLSAKKWAKSKERISQHLENVATQIIKNAALRKEQKGINFEIIQDMLLDFDNTCSFSLTIDQYKTYQEIIQDMSSDIIMDRLICGDVGFGKTELAFRAAYLAMMNGYQVLYLCPTTILAKQQYQKAIERYVGFDISIELFDRSITKKKETEILNNVGNGKLNMIIGTHKLATENLKFKNLGLIIIDEEQRFGVGIKEKIKAKNVNADLLTLSATPIPRTLQISFAGLKDFSIITTPPLERVSVITYLLIYNKFVIKEAIENELQRKGQIFYLENRIENMEYVKNELLKLVPDLKIAMIHGKMPKKEAENIIGRFIKKEYSLLIATTIIENGIDMPNVNTIIVNDADKLGLGQLYQLKGRVGRSNKQAYAYLTIRNDYIITDEARARLNAIKEFTKLGSGIEVAKRDLSIRGAGDFLGREQAGFIETIGIDLYNRMLEIELAKQKGSYIAEQLYEKPLLDVNTACLDNYIDDENMRLEVHQLINTIEDYNTYNNVKKEIKDRFGAINEDTDEYLLSIWFEKLARAFGVTEIKIINSNYNIYIKPGSDINIKYLLNNYDVKIESDHIIIIEKQMKYNMKNLISILQSLV